MSLKCVQGDYKMSDTAAVLRIKWNKGTDNAIADEVDMATEGRVSWIKYHSSSSLNRYCISDLCTANMPNNHQYYVNF